MQDPPQFACPYCGTIMQLLDDRPEQPEKRCWVCPVALEAQRLGILGQPGRIHKAVLIYQLEKQAA